MPHTPEIAELRDMINEVRREIFGDSDTLGLRTEMNLLKQDGQHRLQLLEELRSGQRKIEKIVWSCGGGLAVIEFVIHLFK